MVKSFSIFILVWLSGLVGFYFLSQLLLPTASQVTINTNLVTHPSYFSNPDFYDEAFKKQGPKELSVFPSAYIVNHHLLAADYITSTLQYIATSAPITIVIVSPNHFSAGRSNIIASGGRWSTPYGYMEPNLKLLNKLSSQGLVNVEEGPFDKEHGISGIVPFVKKLAPNASVLPIILKTNASEEVVNNLAHELVLEPNLIVIASVDFSHYLPEVLAKFHDDVSMDALATFDFSIFARLEVDSPMSLELVEKFAQIKGDMQFKILRHSDSSTKAGRDLVADNTSWVTGVFLKGEAVTSSVSSVLLSGGFDSSVSFAEVFGRSEAYAFLDVERSFFGTPQTVYPANNSIRDSYLLKLGFNQSLSLDLPIKSDGINLMYTKHLTNNLKQSFFNNGGDILVDLGNNNFSISAFQKGYIISGITPISLNKHTPVWFVGVEKRVGELSFYPFVIKNINGKFAFCQECKVK